MEVIDWVEGHQQRTKVDGGREEDVDEENGSKESRDTQRDRVMQRVRARRKHVAEMTRKRRKEVTPMKLYRNLQEGEEVHRQGNVDQKNEKIVSFEDEIVRSKVKNVKWKGESKLSSPSDTIGKKHRDGETTYNTQRKEGKRPRLEGSNTQGVFDEFPGKAQRVEVIDEEQNESQDSIHEPEMDSDEDLEMSSEVESSSKYSLFHDAATQCCGTDNNATSSTQPLLRQEPPAAVTASSTTTTRHRHKLMKHKRMKDEKVNESRMSEPKCNRRAASKDFEWKEVRMTEAKGKKYCGGQGGVSCVGSGCRRRRSPHTVSIWTLPVEDPSAVKLSALKPKDIVTSSVMEVCVSGVHGERGSVTDPRLGPVHIASTIPCPTCLNSGCLGHSGYIDLRDYVFHPALVTRCVQTLRKLCYYCLGPALRCQRNLEKVRETKAEQRRLKGCVTNPFENLNQNLCCKMQPKYRMVVRQGVKTVEVVMPGEKGKKIVTLTASTIRAIFAEVSDDSWMYLGMKDPSDELFLRYLRVCPTIFRPPTEKDGHRTPSPLTVLYNNVVLRRNEWDLVNMQMEELLASQDNIVRGGVCLLLDRLVDSLNIPWQSINAPSVVLNKGKMPTKAAAQDSDLKNVSYEEVNGASDEDDLYIFDSPRGTDLPNELDFNSDDEIKDADELEENHLKKHVNRGTEERADEATVLTSPTAEWLMIHDDDDNMDFLFHEEQGEQDDDEEKEAVEHGNAESKVDRLYRIKEQVQDVARNMCKLYQQASMQHIALTSAVAAVVWDQMTKIHGKQGVMRHYMLGKRVNQCARAVFTGNNSLPLGVVGVPRVIANKLFKCIHIHESNLRDCQEMVDRFPEYPCVVSVTRGDQHINIHKLAGNRDNSKCGFRLRPGDVVRRHLMDGDQVIVNRQPTLAKANMETHTVHITNCRTISLNISITDNYAADCDGDEMNLFVPGVESHSCRIMDVKHNVIFSKNGKVSLKIKQDALRGAYAASLRDTFFTLEYFKALMPTHSEVPPPALIKPQRLWTGLQLLSFALPSGLTVDQCGVPMQLDTLVVRHGHILSGVFDKSGQDKILECCKLLLGREAIMITVKLLQSVAERFVDEVGGVGFSFLPEDWSCPANTLDTMRTQLHETLSRAQTIHCPLRRNAKLRQSLADQAKKMVPELSKENNAAAMLKAGSKKRPQKLVQVFLAVGQHNLNDQLPPKHLDGRRLLPFFSKNDTRPQAEGFVDQPLFSVGSVTADALSGMVARSSSYKKHCATGESGYLQRKLGKLMEDLTVRHDGTVRDANDEIVQLVYGGDGLLAERCYTVTLQTRPLPYQVYKYYQTLLQDQCLSSEEQRLVIGELESLRSDQECLYKESKDGRGVDASVPFHLPHLMAHVLATVTPSGPPPCIEDIIGSRDKFFTLLDHSLEKPMCDELQRQKEAWEMMVEARRQMAAAVSSKTDYVMGARPRGNRFHEVNINRDLVEMNNEVTRGMETRILGDPLAMLKVYVRQHVNTFNIHKAAFTKNQLSALLEVMTNLYLESRPPAGECVGALAAQALAEPLMQMTLNACHRAAVASDGDAIPRLSKLLNGQAEDVVVEVRRGGVLRARDYLVHEISQVYSASGEVIDARHVRLVVDYMLKEGTMGGYTRAHVTPHVSFLKAAAFEQPLSRLQHAGKRGRGDNLLGVSENLIFDKTVAVGPNAFSKVLWIQPKSDGSQTSRGHDPQHTHDDLSAAPDTTGNQPLRDADDHNTASVAGQHCLVERTPRNTSMEG